MSFDQAVAATGVLIALAGLAWGVLRVVLPALTRFFGAMEQMFATINGRPAKVDKAGRVQQPAVPSLSVQLADLTRTVSDQQQQNERITAVENQVASLMSWRERHDSLEQVERIVTRAESHQALRTIETVAQQPAKD